jgi:hypothetical protein
MEMKHAIPFVLLAIGLTGCGSDVAPKAADPNDGRGNPPGADTTPDTDAQRDPEGYGRDFITVDARDAAVLEGSSTDIEVRIRRQGNVTGDLQVSLGSLPAGLSVAAGLTIKDGTDTLRVRVAASVKTKQGAKRITVSVTSKAGIVGTKQSTLLVRGPSGTLDRSFGDDGIASYFEWGQISELVIDSNDQIWIGGTGARGATAIGFVAKLRDDGSTDPSWADAGFVPAASGVAPEVDAITVAADGRFAVASVDERNSSSATTANGAKITVFQANGQPDPTFMREPVWKLGADGQYFPKRVQAISFAEGGLLITAEVMKRLDADAQPSGLGTFQHTADGTLRASTLVNDMFDPTAIHLTDGRTLHMGSMKSGTARVDLRRTAQRDIQGTCSLPAPGGAFGLVEAPDGSFFASGVFSSFTETRHFIAHMTAEMALDPRFGSGGVSYLSGTAGGLAVDALGRVTTASFTAGGDASTAQRYLPDGTLDASFGQAGTATLPLAATTPLGTDLRSQVRNSKLLQLGVQRNGRILIAFAALRGGTKRPAIARLWP